MIEGGCFCKKIRYQIDSGDYLAANCHCTMCRRAHGAAFVTWVGAREERFSITAGEELVRWHQSSPQSRRGFCLTCGTTLFFASTLCPGEIHVARPAIQGPLDRDPQCHVFYDQRADWVELGDALPRYATDDPGLAKFKAVSR